MPRRDADVWNLPKRRSNLGAVAKPSNRKRTACACTALAPPSSFSADAVLVLVA